MSIVSILARQRRLLALCALSLALHLLALDYIASRAAPRSEPAPLRIALTARLQPVRAVPAPPPARAPAQAARAPRRATPGPAAATGLPPAALPNQALEGEAPVQMPGRYRVRLPPGVRLSFALSAGAAGQPPAPAGSALIEWQAGIDAYHLRMDGVAGKLSSKGGVGDAGIAPQEAGETRADGSSRLTRFDYQAKRIAFSDSGRSYPIATGSQDRASMLMQLSGMGLAEPDQIQDVIEIFVGGAADAGIVRFQVLGPEQLDSALGTLDTVHLVQLVRPGQTRLDVWLAPARNWYPVQLRATAADGSVSTQLVTRIEQSGD
jgi:hypothetical protein